MGRCGVERRGGGFAPINREETRKLGCAAQRAAVLIVMRFVFIIGHSTHETARTVSPSSSMKGWMPLMYLTSMISSSDIAGSFPFAPEEGENKHSPRPALLNFCEIIHLCRGTVMTIAGYDRHLKELGRRSASGT